MRFSEFKLDEATKPLGNPQAKPGAPATKDKPDLTDKELEDRLKSSPLFNPEVLKLQRELKAKGADLGSYGPNRDGLDGIMGPFTRRAASQHPDIAKNYSSVIDKPNPRKTANVDTSTIQDPDFNRKLGKVAEALGISADDLKTIIKFETAGTFSPTSQDPSGVSIGLIGFTERTAQSLGTSKAELAKMTAVEQLDYVYKFYKMVGVRPGDDRGTIYMLTFMPAFAHSPDDVVLGQRGGGILMLPNGKSSGLSMDKIWSQNPVFAKSKGRDSFTVGDVKSKINSRT